MMRARQLGLDLDGPARVGRRETRLEDLYRLLAIAKYEDRYVISPAHAETPVPDGPTEQLFCNWTPKAGPA